MSRVDHRGDLAICSQEEVGSPPAKAIRRVSGRASSVVARHSAACYPPTRSASKTWADAPAAARSSGGMRFQQGGGHGRGVPSLERAVAPAALFYQPPVVAGLDLEPQHVSGGLPRDVMAKRSSGGERRNNGAGALKQLLAGLTPAVGQIGVGPCGLFKHKLQRPEPLRDRRGKRGELLKQPSRLVGRQECWKPSSLAVSLTSRGSPLPGEGEELSLVTHAENSRAGHAGAGGYLLDRGACIALPDEHLRGGRHHRLAGTAGGLLAQRRAVLALGPFGTCHAISLYSRLSHLT